MPRIAVSGHRGLSAETEQLVDQAIRKLLATTAGDITGLSCLADGADQIFARAVLDHGGTIEAIVPAQQYRDALPDEAHAEYDRLISIAHSAHRLDYVESDSEAHMAASAYTASPHAATAARPTWSPTPVNAGSPFALSGLRERAETSPEHPCDLLRVAARIGGMLPPRLRRAALRC